MFDLFGRRQNKEDIARLRKEIAVLRGEINAIHLLLQTVVDRIPKTERRHLVDLWKYAVGQGFGGDAPWLDKDHKQAYNNAMSAMIQAFIEKAHTE
jgi:hypothetical protein